MEFLRGLPEALRAFVPLLEVLAVFAVVLTAIHYFGRRRERQRGIRISFARQILVLGVLNVGLVAAILVLPLPGDATRGQLLSLLGLVLTAILTLSSTHLVSNAMAGVMLRAVGGFRPGDFVRVGDQFGRVTERGLFHTELQTEDRDLTTLPNLYLITNPLTVVRSSGTIVSASVSLGYDQHHAAIERLLVGAAEAAQLSDPFVYVTELGDFSVGYRVSGFLENPKQLLTARSSLRKQMLDALHGAGVEIVSPTFMNQRRLDAAAPVLAEPRAAARSAGATPSPEALMFDKAECMSDLEALRAEQGRLSEEIEALEGDIRKSSETEQRQLASELARRRARNDEITRAIAQLEEQVEAKPAADRAG